MTWRLQKCASGSAEISTEVNVPGFCTTKNLLNASYLKAAQWPYMMIAGSMDIPLNPILTNVMEFRLMDQAKNAR